MLDVLRRRLPEATFQGLVRAMEKEAARMLEPNAAMCTPKHCVALLHVARQVVELVRRADPDHVPVPLRIDGSELASIFPLQLDVVALLGDGVPARPRLQPVHAPCEPAAELSPLERLLSDPLVTAFTRAAVAEARDSRYATSYRGQPGQQPRLDL